MLRNALIVGILFVFSSISFANPGFFGTFTNASNDISVIADAGDITSPEFSSATIDGSTFVVNWSENCTQGTGYDDSDLDLDMSVTGSDVALTYVSGDGTSQWTYTAASAAVEGETVDLDFNGDADSIEDGAGNDLAALNSESVTNNTSGTCTVDNDGAIVTLNSSTNNTNGQAYSDVWIATQITVDANTTVTEYSLNIYNATTDNTIVLLYTDSSNSPGSEVADTSVTKNGGVISDTLAYTSFVLTVPKSITTASYWIVLHSSSSGSTYWQRGDDAGKNRAYSTNAGVAWTVVNGSSYNAVLMGCQP